MLSDIIISQVPCLIGSAESRKTSLFVPIRGIVPTRHIRKITKQRQFNKAMMSRDCEVIFLDEATADLMDIDDWNVKSFPLSLNGVFTKCDGMSFAGPVLIALFLNPEAFSSPV